MREGFSGFLVLLFISQIIMVLFLGWSLLIGWIITMILTFSLFEGTVLAIIATGFSIYALTNILASTSPMLANNGFRDEGWFDPAYEIPEDRFYKADSIRTWENWFRYQLANSIHEELKYSSSSSVKNMQEAQLQELAIRLTDISFRLIKAKSPRTSKLRITVSDLKKEMTRMELKPYDDEILFMVINMVNLNLNLPFMKNVFREQLWDEPALVV